MGALPEMVRLAVRQHGSQTAHRPGDGL